MTAVGVYEAKTHLPKLLARVEKGERITITRHGVPIAELVPVSARARMTPQEAAAAIRELRKGQRLDGITIRELIEEGRR
jgi:prevent-host-death family protein